MTTVAYQIRIGTPAPGTYTLSAVQGSYALTGAAATLTYSPVSTGALAWSTTVTGSSKSAQSGFAAPVVFYDGTTRQGGRIYPVTTAENVDIYFERLLGETGSISVTITLFASTNTVSGTHFTPTTATLTWADGEIGWKNVTCPVLAIPTGFGLVGITCSGANSYRPTSWLWLQGTGHVASAKYMITSNGTNVSGNTSGSGTTGSPWQSLAHACSQMGTGGGVLYVQYNGTHTEWSGTAGSGAGIAISNACSNTAPLIVMPDPSNATKITIDNGCTGAGGSSILFSNADGIDINSSASSIWLCGLNIARGNVSFFDGGSSVRKTDCVIWQCEIYNYSTAGSNTAAIRFDLTDYFIAQDYYVHNIYSTETYNNNPYDSEPSGLEEGCHAFYPNGATFAHGRHTQTQYGIFLKNAGSPTTYTAIDVTHCLFLQHAASNVANSGSAIGLPPQSFGYYNAAVRYNVSDSTSNPITTGNFVSIDSGGNSQGQSHFIDVFNNVSIKNNGLFYGGGTVNVRVYNNISQNSNSGDYEIRMLAAAPQTESLEYSDFNTYVNGNATWGILASSYSGLTNWKAATTNANLLSAPDQNSTATAVAPSYQNQSLHQYQIAGSSGRGGRPIGVGLESVGIVNNFLNTSLLTT